jgi:hypothetical protein
MSPQPSTPRMTHWIPVEAYETDTRRLVASELGSEVLRNAVSFNTQFSIGISFTIAKGVLEVAGYNEIEQIQIFFSKLRPEEQTARYLLTSSLQSGCAGSGLCGCAGSGL